MTAAQSPTVPRRPLLSLLSLLFLLSRLSLATGPAAAGPRAPASAGPGARAAQGEVRRGRRPSPPTHGSPRGRPSSPIGQTAPDPEAAADPDRLADRVPDRRRRDRPRKFRSPGPSPAMSSPPRSR